MKKQMHSLVLGIVALAIGACGTKPTASNNASGGMSITSKAFSSPAAAALNAISAAPKLAALPVVEEFKLCIGKVKFEDADGRALTKDKDEVDAEGSADADDSTEVDEHSGSVEKEADENGEFEFSPGLIDLSAGTQVEWGKIHIPSGYQLSKLKVKVKKDKDVCGVDYSVSFNGMTSDQDIEFKWKFNPAVEITDNSKTIALSLDSVVATLREAILANDLSSLKERVEQIEDAAEKEE